MRGLYLPFCIQKDGRDIASMVNPIRKKILPADCLDNEATFYSFYTVWASGFSVLSHYRPCLWISPLPLSHHLSGLGILPPLDLAHALSLEGQVHPPPHLVNLLSLFTTQLHMGFLKDADSV